MKVNQVEETAAVAVERQLDTQFSGSLIEAYFAGQRLMLARRILRGEIEISESTFKMAVLDPEDGKRIENKDPRRI